MRDRDLLLTVEFVDSFHELHFLDAPQTEIASIRISYELFTVRTEVDQFDPLANLELSEVPEVYRPDVVVGAGVLFSVCEVD